MKLDDVCRCCLSENTEMFNIYSNVQYEENEEVIFNMLTWVFNIEIIPDDGLPTVICSRCLSFLKSAYSFKETAENSLRILLQRLTNKESNNFDLSDEEPLAHILKNNDNNTSNVDDTDHHEDEDIKQDETLFELNKIGDVDQTPYQSNLKIGIYYCTMCPNKFTDPTDMYIHYNKSHDCDKTGRPCDHCNQRFPDFRSLLEHRKRHFHPYVCTVCWRGFYDESEFNSHASSCELVTEDTLDGDNARKMTMCHVCGKSYPNTYLSVHMKIHNEGSLPCPYCGKKFKQPASLGSHVIWNHKKVKKHKCEYCDKLFMTSSARGTHIRESHMKEKNVACETCGKLFFSKSRMKRHNFTHTGEKNFSCNQCDKSYQTRFGLNVHLKSHLIANNKLCI